MRVWQGIFCGVLLVPLTLWSALPAQAVSVSGRASTVMEWYDSAREDTAVPVYQYLQLSLRDLGGEGYNFRGYGRIADDLNSEADIDSRLYFAYLEKKDLFDGLDFRLGRQFISTTAGASLMDGLALDYRLSDTYAVKLFGGGDVSYYEGYNVKDVLTGIELTAHYRDSIDLGLSYLQKWEGGLIAQELAGFDANIDIRGKLWLYNELQWDILSERLSYANLGGKYRFDAPFTLRLEYLYSLPVFSSTSIYSVFAVEEYEEVLAEATWHIRRGLQAYARYVRELYDEFSDADVFEIGLEKLRTGKFSGYVSGICRIDDDGQDLKGFKIRGAYRLTEWIEAGLGANIDVLEREIDFFETDGSSDETTSQRYWADVTWHINKKTNLQAKFERIESDLWDYYNRGTVRFNIQF